MKVVFDTNVWVSALIKPQGVSARIFEATTPFQSVTSKEIIRWTPLSRQREDEK